MDGRSLMIWSEIFYYKEGRLFWVKDNRNKKANSVAGWVNSLGYTQVCYQSKYYKAHRIIWEIHYGPIPSNLQIDHINGARSDNRIENLRLATNQENSFNKKGKSKLGKGIYFDKKVSRYKASINLNGRHKFIGYYETLEEAAEAYNKQAKLLHGDFAYQHNLEKIK